MLVAPASEAASAAFVGRNALFGDAELGDGLAGLMSVAPIIGGGIGGVPLPNCWFLSLGLPGSTPETVFLLRFTSRLLAPFCIL